MSTTPNVAWSLKELRAGNVRHLCGQARYSTAPPLGHNDTSDPLALVFACSDLRFAPELLFDANLLVLQNARLTLDDAVVGSIAIALSRYRMGLVVILDHRPCKVFDAGWNHGATRSSQLVPQAHAVHVAMKLRTHFAYTPNLHVAPATVDEASQRVEFL